MASAGAAAPTSATATTSTSATTPTGAATTPTPATGTTKTVSASLWWDSFVSLSDDLDRAAVYPVSDSLAKRIKSHHAWLRGSTSMFGKPNEVSRSALNAGEVVVGEHWLAIKPELKEAALNVSKCLVVCHHNAHPQTHDIEINNYWNTFLKKRLTKMGIDPVTHTSCAPTRSPLAGPSCMLSTPPPPPWRVLGPPPRHPPPPLPRPPPLPDRRRHYPPTPATGTTKTVSASLWWDSFVSLSDDLDRAAVYPVSDSLAKRIKSHHAWLRGSTSMFGKPNEVSRSALNAGEVVVGEHWLAIKPELKEAALNVSKCLVSVQYYLERQCLLKCIRRIFVHANDGSDATDAIREEASLLINEEIERKLISTIEDSFSAAFSVKADIICGTYDVGKFAVSVEAKNSFHYAKAQLLLVLIETLDFENLLLMIRDEVPFSGGSSAFSIGDILEMDVEISKLNEFLMIESGPLILAWAVFLCLVQSLPGSNASLEIDHTSYAQRAFEFAPFNYLLGFLCTSIFRESDGPVSGYRGILRAFISAFIASYEVPYQAEDNSLDTILSIICEESLCMQFWDKDSFVDGPIRSVLNMVEKEYPFKMSELIRFLSAVCHGNWPAQFMVIDIICYRFEEEILLELVLL
ncbi:hypothetical protein PR202_gb07707 [Eleusine coracana subsp. coracana]|uniref:Uncharacterized protein n=1 Tax=Eleusine coracana subsp. coracana TaxID=191504 RepID=A0AAV5ECX2_ELECO|nr:hypothetical protein PR202_gb07707 [Eleusine coracana subsp. coracana]